MIQVCSSCATRWNVRDRQRAWCPRCHGALLAPVAEGPAPVWSGQPSPPSGPAPQRSAPVPQRTAPRLPAGYHWIAVRPGAAPPPRRRRRPLGPTPRYPVIPRWGLVDQLGPGFAVPPVSVRTGPSALTVRVTLLGTALVLAAAALVHLIRYVLLIVNRSTLLNPVVAAVAVWSGAVISAAAIVAVVICAVVLTRWLIARRAAVFAHLRGDETRSPRALWAGCLIPLVNLFWAPVFVIELAAAEQNRARLRQSILVWWIFWVLSTAVSLFAIATSFPDNTQGIADNHVTMTFAYLLALATVLTLGRVISGFERKPVQRPAHRWVMVTTESRPTSDSPVQVESDGREPAA